MRRSLTIIAVLLIALPLFCFAAVYVQGTRHSDASADVAIVLGAAVWENAPSPVFQERIAHGLTLYRQGRVRYLLFTGGLGDGKQISEAEAAKREVIAAGIPASHILTETESHTTYQNLYYARAVMREHKLTTALIVSDPPHMLRALMMADQLGMAASPAPTPTTRYTAFWPTLRFQVNETRLFFRHWLWRCVYTAEQPKHF